MGLDDALAALAACQAIEADYHGHRRILEIHAVGISHAGAPVMLCWQLDGGSASEERVGWKLLKLRDIVRVAVTGRASEAPRPGYRRPDRMMRVTAEAPIDPLYRRAR